MEDKLKQANSNIEHLINKVLQFKMEAKESYCYFPRERFDEKWNCDDLNCSDCKKKYYNAMKKELQDEYIIK